MFASSIIQWLGKDQPADDLPAAAEIRSQQLAYFVRSIPINSFANLANSLIVAAIAWLYVPSSLLIAWLVPSWVFVLWHLRKWYKNRWQVRPPRVSRRGSRRAMLWAAIPGFFWGCTSFFVPYMPELYWLLLLIITAGMTAGAAATLAAIPGAAAAFIVSATAPWLVHFLAQDDPFHQAITLMIVVFMLAMLATTRSVYLAIMEGIRVRHKNLSLLQQFRAERDEWFEISDTSEAFALFDDADRLLLWNENYRRILSLPEESLRRGAHHEDLMRLASPPMEVTRGRRSAEDWIEEQRLHLQGSGGTPAIEQLSNGRWLRTSSRKTRRGRKFVLHVDITELKDRETAQIKAHEELQHSERRFQDFAEASVDWFWEMDQDLCFTYMSNNIQARMGISPDELIGKTRPDLIRQADPVAWQDHLKALAAREPFRDFVYLSRVGKERRRLWIKVSGVPIFGKDGAFLGYRGSGSDVTKQIDALEALRVSEEQLRLVIDSLPVLICYVDRHGKYRFVNKACESWYARPHDEIVGHSVEHIHGEAYENYRPNIVAVMKGEAVEFELSNTYGDGRRRDVRVIYVPHFGEGGQVEGFFALAEDITQRKMLDAERALAKRALRDREARLHDLQRQLEQVSRSNALGQLSSALAHELNQPLAAIINYVRAGSRLLKCDPGEDESKVCEVLEKAVEQAARAGDVIRGLRGLFEAGDQEVAPHDINQVVEDAAALALLDAPVMGITFQLKLADELPPVTIDRIQIQQVVLNLVRNAVDALDGEKRRNLVIRTAPEGDRRVVVSVCDSGPGLPDEVAARLFEPFVSQKSSGMGLGLSISHRIIEAHDGRIWTEPGQPRGTCFKFTLPVDELVRAAE